MKKLSTALILMACLSAFAEAAPPFTKEIDITSPCASGFMMQRQLEEYKDYKPVIVPEFFIMGLLDDYMGRSRYMQSGNRADAGPPYTVGSYDLGSRDLVDRYFPHERAMCEYIVEYIKEYITEDVEVEVGPQGHSDVYSATLARRINKHYDSKGTIKPEVFTNEDQMCSFLLGNYFRYGTKKSDYVYKIVLANTHKDKIIPELLLKLKVSQLFYERTVNTIPASFIFIFQAPVKLEKYFELVKDGKLSAP